MAKRKIIKIDEEKCNGCGRCIPNCPEGALQVIDGKAHLISDLFCDGLGACIGECPFGAISIEEREASEYDEKKVMENIVKGGINVIRAHLEHLRSHGEKEYLMQAASFLKEKGINLPIKMPNEGQMEGTDRIPGCPGARMMDFSDEKAGDLHQAGSRPSHLRQWPVQLHLISPLAPYFQNKDVVLSADCVAYALGDFHKDYLKGRSLAIACPKLDSNQDIYKDKLVAFIDQAKVNTITVLTMEVPCCSGLLRLAQDAVKRAKRKVPIRSVVVGIKGNIVFDEWV